MGSAAAPPPIAGTPIDPPPAEVPAFAEKLDRTPVGAVLYRTLLRYTNAKVGLLASGTAYYLFLALLSLLAFVYGVITLVGADELAARLTDFLAETLPGLVGEEGIDPEQLRATGATAGIVGLVLMLYSSLSAVGGANNSMHLIFGAPPDPRPFIKAKLRFLGILLMVVPLIALSFVAVSLTSDLIEPLLDRLGINTSGTRALLTVTGVLVGYAIDVLILRILLGRLGGIRPHRRPMLLAALIGAVAVGVIKQFLDFIITWSLDKPQYGAFAIPLAILFVLSLLSQALYGSAALAAGISDADVPLRELTPEDAVDEVPDPDEPGE